MLRNLLQPLLALLLSCLLACPPSLAQGRQNSSSQADPQAQVKPDLKRAKKLMELGAKEEAAGAYEEALAAYDEAVRYAPFDVTIVGKAAALRSKLVQSYVDKAERISCTREIFWKPPSNLLPLCRWTLPTPCCLSA